MKKVILCAFIVFSVTPIFIPVYAEKKIEDEIKYRQSAMMFMRWNMGKIKQQVVKHPESFKKDQVIAAANVIASIANSGLGELFGEHTRGGTGWKKTRAKDALYDDPEEVSKRAKIFRQEANRLSTVSRNGDIENIAIQFDKTFKSCKGCHKKFREKKPKT